MLARGVTARSEGLRAGSRSVVVAGAADDDAVLFDRDLDRPVTGPVLGVDRVVLDRGVEPQSVALLAVIERALERTRLPAPERDAAHAAPATAATAACARLRRVLVLVVGVAAFGLPLGRFLLGLRLRLGARALGGGFGGLELGGDQRVVLGAQVDLVRVLAAPGVPSAASSSARSFWRLNCSMSRTLTSS